MTITSTQWQDAYKLWLESRRSDSTRRAYETAFKDLLASCGKSIEGITRADMARWMAAMKVRNLAGKSICLALAAVSSFYTYLRELYVMIDESGVEVPATNANPTIGIQKPLNRPRQEIYYLNREEVQRLLGTIDQTTVIGLRNYALILSYLMMGRRNSEVRKLRWGDFDHDGDIIYYVWSGKGRTNVRAECPAPVWIAITKFLQSAGRLELINGSDYIFTPVEYSTAKPLSMQEVGRILKNYARAAGLDSKRLHVHCLRHTATMLRLEVGESLLDVSNYLGHASIATTQSYIHRLQGHKDKGWSKVAGLIGV
jgi:site-specific recombinase XerD